MTYNGPMYFLGIVLTIEASLKMIYGQGRSYPYTNSSKTVPKQAHTWSTAAFITAPQAVQPAWLRPVKH